MLSLHSLLGRVHPVHRLCDATTGLVELDAWVVGDERVTSPFTGLEGVAIRWRFLEVRQPLNSARFGAGLARGRPIASGAVGSRLLVASGGTTLEIPVDQTTFHLVQTGDVGAVVDRPIPACFRDVLATRRPLRGELYYDEYVFTPGEPVRVHATAVTRRPSGGAYRTAASPAEYVLSAGAHAEVLAGPCLHR